VLMAALYHPGDDPSRVYYGTDTRAQVILFGAALGALSAGVPRLTGERARRLLVWGAGAAAVLLVLAFALLDAETSWLYEGGYGAVGVLVALVIAGAAQPGRDPLARLLEHRTIVGLGLISYGVYLWHWPAFVWVTEKRFG